MCMVIYFIKTTDYDAWYEKLLYKHEDPVNFCIDDKT